MSGERCGPAFAHLLLSGRRGSLRHGQSAFQPEAKPVAQGLIQWPQNIGPALIRVPCPHAAGWVPAVDQGPDCAAPFKEPDEPWWRRVVRICAVRLVGLHDVGPVVAKRPSAHTQDAAAGAEAAVSDFQVETAKEAGQREADHFFRLGDGGRRGRHEGWQRLEQARVACCLVLGGSAFKAPSLRPLFFVPVPVGRIDASIWKPAGRLGRRPKLLVPVVAILTRQSQAPDAFEDHILGHTIMIAELRQPGARVI
jgi:hypothetical protein